MNPFQDLAIAERRPRVSSVSLSDVEEERLVIAIDYGTTYTGVAIATPIGNRADLDKINVIQDWGEEMSNESKVPSVISYSLSSEKLERQWGADLSPKAIAMVHTKLQLDVDLPSTELDLILQALDGMHNLNFQYIVDSGNNPTYTGQSPEEIVEDYLQKVYEGVIASQGRDGFGCLTDEGREQFDTDIVITIPAEWGYRGRNSTFRALTRAGFNKTNFKKLRDIILISEPEAAAIYTARYLTETSGADFLRKGECFVLCDAGGGTVDVVSYEVKKLSPVLEIGPVTKPAGERCGAIFINLAFKKWLRNLLGEAMYRELDQGQHSERISSHDAEGERMRELMKTFDVIKRKFVKGHRDIKLDLPEPYHNLNLDTRVIGGQITITSEEMESFFDPRTDRIVDLIVGQVNQIKKLRKTPKNVFLVGGFAESPYLQQEIQTSCNVRRLRLRIPDTSWTAVVRGAAIIGIEKKLNDNLTTMTACRRSYGVAVRMLFSAVVHHPDDMERDPLTRIPMAKGQLIWIIQKGDLILSTQPKEVTGNFPISFTETGERTGSIPIYAYDYEDLPERLATSEGDLKLVETIEYDLKDIPLHEFTYSGLSNPPYYTAELKLVMLMAPEMLQIRLNLGEREIRSKNVPEPIPDEWEEF